MAKRAAVCNASGIPLVERASTSFLVLVVKNQLAVQLNVVVKVFLTFVSIVDFRGHEVNKWVKLQFVTKLCALQIQN